MPPKGSTTQIRLHCQICQSPFMVPPSRAAAKFCSNMCRGLARRVERVPRICPTCGKHFEIHLSDARRGFCQFCSQACDMEHRRGARKVEWVTLECANCGDSFERTPAWVRKHADSRFCSKACHDEFQQSESLLDRFLRNLPADRTPEECWEWQGTRDEDGYGVLTYRGKQLRANRVAVELFERPLEDDEWSLHHCDNPPCCNPGHLYIGLSVDNVADRIARKRDRPQRGEQRWNVKLDSDKVREIREAAATGESHTANAPRFGVSREAISAVVRRVTWKHVE